MFKRTKSKQIEWIAPNIKVKYPKWSYVYNKDNSKYYLILGKSKKQFISERAFWSWKMQPLVTTNNALSGYPTYGKIGFRPGTIVISMSNLDYYIGDENKRHQISTPDFYAILGFTRNNAYVISDDELEFHEEGEKINGVYL